MRSISRYTRRFAFAFSLALLVGGAFAAVAMADTNVNQTAPTLEITGSSLDLTNFSVGNFTPVQLNGVAQSTTATGTNFVINDKRGSGAGWHLTVAATQFTQYANDTYGTKTLPTGSLSMLAPTVVVHDGLTNTSDSPTIVDGPYTIDAGSAVTVSNAASDAGMGQWDYAQGGVFTLGVPANAYAVTYRSDVTVSAVSAP